MRPSTTMQSLAQLHPSFVQMGQLGGFDAALLAAGQVRVGAVEFGPVELAVDQGG